MFAVTLDAGIAGEHVADPLQGFFGVALLDMTDQGVNHRHAEDHQGIDPVTHNGGQRRGSQQHVNQYVVKVGESAASPVYPSFPAGHSDQRYSGARRRLREFNPAAWLFCLRQHCVNGLLPDLPWRGVARGRRKLWVIHLGQITFSL